MTLIVNFFGGPGAGKSTLAAGTFYRLKQNHINCELVTEYAKELTWENRVDALECQPFIFGKQLYSLERLLTKVDVIVTDSPICLSLFYKAYKYPESFSQSVIDIFNTFKNMNFFVDRGYDNYDNNGRINDITTAKEIDTKILKFLTDNQISCTNIAKNYDSTEIILEQIRRYLEKNSRS